MDATTVRRAGAVRAALAVSIGIAVATVGAVPSSAAPGAADDGSRCRAPRRYTTVEIEPLGTGYNVAADLNDRGVVVGRSETPDGMHAFVWRRGRTLDITPPGGQDAVAAGINDRGEVLHDWYDPAAGGQVAIWRNGRSTVIDTAAGDGRAINERGEALYANRLWTGGQVVPIEGDIDGFLVAQVLGDGGHVAGNVTPPRVPGGGHPSPATGFLWHEGELVEALPPVGRAFRQAIDIDSRGRILFDAYGGSAALWDRGTTVDLGTLGGGELGPADINDRGQVVGSSTTDAGELHAFRWEDGRMTDLAPVAGTASYAGRINERGEATGVLGSRAVVWACGRTIDLGTPPDAWPADINDRGQVLVNGGGYETGRMFLSTPTPR